MTDRAVTVSIPILSVAKDVEDQRDKKEGGYSHLAKLG